MNNTRIVVNDSNLRIFEHLPDLYMILSPDLIIQTASNAHLEATYSTREQIVGKHIFDVFPDNPKLNKADGLLNLKHSFEEVLFYHKQHVLEAQRYDVKLPDHLGGGFEEKYWTITNIPVVDEKENILYIINKVNDVTEQIKKEERINELTEQAKELELRELAAQKEIEKERLRLHNLFMQAPALIAIINSSDLTFQFANPKYLEVLGLSESIVGKSLKEVIPDIGQDIVDVLNKVFDKGERFIGTDFPVEADWSKNGNSHLRYFTFIYEPLRDEDGTINNLTVLGFETTEHVKSREQINNRNEELKRINSVLDNFVHMVAHDLRSPITNLQQLVTLINQTEDVESRNEYFKLMNTATNRLDLTVNGLIEIIEIQNKETNGRFISLQEAIERVKEEFSETIAAYKIEINSHCELCPFLYYNMPYLNSILTNLISNAIKYRSNRRTLKITIHCERKDEFTLISVADNGMGMDLERYGKNLFKPFTRFAPPSISGKGIGLHLIKNIIEKNGGKIEVKSRLNEGTTFYAYLKEYPENI